jgi:hypothetical protein
MADIRTLKLSLLADTSQFTSNLNKAENDTRSFGDKIGDTLKKGAVAFAALGAAAGVMAIKIGVDAVKAAIEDEKSQATLAKTLQNTTKATDAQIKATETYIDKTARATGITDDALRPSLDRLVRSTGDVTKAQKLQTLALDVSAGTGKDLAAVSEALGKAYDGNFGALKKLGIPLDENIIKTKNFDAAVKVMSDTFAGQADIAANTFAGRMSRITIAVDEAKESLGQALLPVLDRFATFATNTLVPTLEQFVAGLTGNKGVKKAVYDAGTGVVSFTNDMETSESGGYGLGASLRELGITIVELNKTLFGASGEGSGLKQMLDGLTSLVNLVNTVLGPFQKLAEISRNFAETAGQSRIDIPGNFSRVSFPPLPSAGTTVNVNVSGAVDKISTARTVVSAVNKATKTGTANKLAQSALGVGIR